MARLPRLLLVLLLVCLGAVRAGAQRIIPESIDSVELRTANAQTIVVGTVVEVAPEGGSYTPPEVTIAVQETLKGEPKGLLRVPLAYSRETLEAWRQTAARILVTVPGEPAPHWRRSVTVLADPKLLVSRDDFTLIRDPDRLLRTIRELVRGHPKAEGVAWFALQPPENDVGRRWTQAYGYEGHSGLKVPQDARMERRARAEIRPGPVKRRIEGVRALGLFRSDENVALLEALLADPAYTASEWVHDGEVTETRIYEVRAAAYAALQAWGIAVGVPETVVRVSGLESAEALQIYAPKGDLAFLSKAKRLRSLLVYGSEPLSDEQFSVVAGLTGLTDLSLTHVGIDDMRLRGLVRLKKLRTLRLDDNPITDAGLPEIAKLRGLREVSLARTGVTDAGLDALRKARRSLTVGPVRAIYSLSPAPIHRIPETDALCERTAYTLLAGDLKGWSSAHEAGAVTGEIGWSRTPSGRDYLGPLGQQAATLTLKKLPRHRNVHVEIELFVIGSWDGDGRLGAGPDVLDVAIPGVGTMLHSTFFNNDEGDAAELPLQSFPDFYPGIGHRAYTGAAESRTLGFAETWDGQPFRRDAVYRIQATFAHTGSDLRIVLTGLNVTQGGVASILDDERWGIGGLVVRTD